MRATIPTRLAPLASTSTLPPLSVPKSSAIYNSPSYFSKYRNPYYHNQPPQHKKLEENVVRTVKRISRDETGNPSNGGARERRLEMERMWSGGEASPPIPEENSTESNRFLKPKHALLFVGTGSQYVGMGKALENSPAAKEVYREAEEALEGFEDWRRGLKLGECEGQVGELGRLLERSTTQRLKERKLRAVIQDGPQVGFSFLSAY